MNKYRNKVVYLDGKKFDSKKEFERYCWGQGYKYEVCRSFENFVEIVENYLL